MSVQRAIEDVYFRGRLREAEVQRVARIVFEREREVDFGGDELRGTQLEGESVEKAAEEEE